MAKTAAAISREIADNLRGTSAVNNIKILMSGSVYLGTTGMYLRLEASRRGAKLSVDQGSFDDPLHDLQNIDPEDAPFAVILCPYFDSITQEFEARQNELTIQDINDLQSAFAERWQKIITTIPATSKTVVLGLHPTHFLYPFGQSKISEILDCFNNDLRKIVTERSGAVFVDMEALMTKIGLRNAIDQRMYLRAKSPYAPEYCQELASAISDVLSFNDRIVKVIALDCDNTLWGGILGEDGFDGIQIDPNTYKGSLHHLVQRRFLELKELGILLCLVSKNDESDVLQVLDQHEHQLIRTTDVITHRINWDSKSRNLKSIASELNLGLSSFIFIDDSPFECAEVIERCPEIKVFQVSDNEAELLNLLYEVKKLCLAGRPEIVQDKTSEYVVRKQINTFLEDVVTGSDFLEKLNVRITIDKNKTEDVPRLAEMFSKTNQFNSTTIRRTAEELKQIMLEESWNIYSVRVTDRFTNHGLTAIFVTVHNDECLTVTDWMMSCRILGRDIERGILSEIGKIAIENELTFVSIEYEETTQNKQVMKLLDNIYANGGNGGKSRFVFDPNFLVALVSGDLTS